MTAGGEIGATLKMNLDRAVASLNEMFDRALKVRDDVILLSHGGPISGAKEAEYVNLKTKAVSFVAASSFERIPIERALKQVCDEFKSIRISGESPAA